MQDYGTLRYISLVIIGVGWAYIILGWVVSVLLGLFWIDRLQTLLDFPLIVFSVLMLALVLVVGGLLSLPGFLVIATGQVYLVLLDIRNDTRATLREVREAMIMLEDKQ